MRKKAFCCLLILLLAPLCPAGPRQVGDDAGAEAQAAPAPPPPERVILQINRHQEAMGTVELEDENVIVIRNRKGEVESFSKARLLGIVRLVKPEPGQAGTVFLRDGQTREGIVIEDEFDYVLLEIEGIRAKLRRETVSHVALAPTFEQTYAQYKEALQPGMYDAHLLLCRWLIEQRKYEFAKREILELLDQAEMPEARKLLTVVEAQLALATRPPKPDGPASQPSDDEKANAEEEAPAGPVHAVDLLPQQILTDEDVNLIRVYEIDFEHPTRITITPETVRELIEKYGTSDLVPSSQTGRNAMFRAASDRPLDVVRLMFELRARDLYPQITVNTEPYALNLFRQRVHDTWLINTCATNACHGQPFAGRFFLHRKNYKDENVRYTNLLILEKLQLDPEWPLINHEKPEESLIIQYGLPRDLARKPHPFVSNWKAAFSPTNHRMQDDAVQWIKSMMQPRPVLNGELYGVPYEPPVIGGERPAAGEPADPNRPPR